MKSKYFSSVFHCAFVVLCSLSFSLSAKPSAQDENKFNRLINGKSSLEQARDKFNKMSSLRNQAQIALERLLKKNRSRVEVQLRYGQLLLQKARDIEEYSLELDFHGKHKLSEKYRLRSDQLYSKGLKLHKKMLLGVKNHPQLPNIYYGIAKTEFGLRNYRKAYLVLNKALKLKVSDRSTMLQILLLRGDSSFQIQRLSDAKSSYKRALKYAQKNSVNNSYIRYKLAWTEYNLKNPMLALKYLRGVIQDNRDKLELGQEAVRDYALFAADLNPAQFKSIGGIKGVFNYLKKASDRESAQKSYDVLAEVFYKNGHREEGIKALEFVIQDEFSNPKNADRALTIVKWQQDLTDKRKLTERYYWLISKFGPKSHWHQLQSLRTDVQRNSVVAIEESLREYVIGLHKEAQEEKSKARRKNLEKTLAKLYDVHIASFNSFPRIHFYRAELHRSHKEWEKAAIRYDAFIKILENTPKAEIDKLDKSFVKEAAISSVQMWAKAIDKKPSLASNMVESGEKFIRTFPNHKKAPQVLLDIAKVDFKTKKIESALKKVHYLVKRYPRTKQVSESVHASLDILNKEKDYINLARSARNWIKTASIWAPVKEKAKIVSELKGILGRTEAKACEEMAKDKSQALEAALCYDRFAKNYPKHKFSSQALATAARLYKKHGDNSSALDSLEMLIKNYPSSKESGAAYAKLASEYEKNFLFEKSAGVYEKLLERKETPGKTQMAERLLYILQGTHQPEKMEYWLKKPYVKNSLREALRRKNWQQSVQRLRALERQFGYLGGNFKSPEAQKIYGRLLKAKAQGILTKDIDLELLRFKGHFAMSQKNYKKADQIWMSGLKKFWRIKPKSSELWEVGARTRLSQGSYWVARFNRQSLKKNPDSKVKLFKKVENWFAEVINMKSPAVALEALWETAKLYESFSKDLKALPSTKQLGGDMEQKSGLLIKEIARRAKNWGVISPVLLDALKTIRKENSKGAQAELASAQLSFPWTELPHWIDLSPEEAKWQEWLWSREKLSAFIRNKKNSRSAQKRAALVYLVRGHALEAGKLQMWARLFTSKIGIQARIQAFIKAGDAGRAELFLNSYEDFYGRSAFTEHFRGKLEWEQGNYSQAYQRWLGAGKSKDFRSVYYAAGWQALLEELVEGKLKKSDKRYLFKQLQPLAKKSWEKQLIATLCIKGTMLCQRPYNSYELIEISSLKAPKHLRWEYYKANSVWNIRKETLEALITLLGPRAPNYKKFHHIRKALSEYYKLAQYSLSWGEQKGNYKRLKGILAKREKELDAESRARALASSRED